MKKGVCSECQQVVTVSAEEIFQNRDLDLDYSHSLYLCGYHPGFSKTACRGVGSVPELILKKEH